MFKEPENQQFEISKKNEELSKVLLIISLRMKVKYNIKE